MKLKQKVASCGNRMQKIGGLWMRAIKKPTFRQKMWGLWVTAETISKNMGSLGDSSAENRRSLKPYIRVTSIKMGVPLGVKCWHFFAAIIKGNVLIHVPLQKVKLANKFWITNFINAVINTGNRIRIRFWALIDFTEACHKSKGTIWFGIRIRRELHSLCLDQVSYFLTYIRSLCWDVLFSLGLLCKGAVWWLRGHPDQRHDKQL